MPRRVIEANLIVPVHHCVLPYHLSIMGWAILWR